MPNDPHRMVFHDDGPEPLEPFESKSPRAITAQRFIEPEERDPKRRWCLTHDTPWLRIGAFAACPDCFQSAYPPPEARERAQRGDLPYGAAAARVSVVQRPSRSRGGKRERADELAGSPTVGRCQDSRAGNR